MRQLTLREERNNRDLIVEDVAFAFQHAAVGELMSRVEYALEHSQIEYQSLVLAGGVAANSEVRKQILNLNVKYPHLNILVPPLWACMDQAAMIGIAGQIAFDKGVRGDCEISALSNKQLISY